MAAHDQNLARRARGCALQHGSTRRRQAVGGSEDEAKKVKAALTEWGCEGGTIEKESEATGVFEVDDAKCKGA